MNDEMMPTKKKVKIYFEKSKMVHVKVKDKFYNGYISEIGADFFMLSDRVLGEIPVFYQEIENIEVYTTLIERGEKDGI